ncbi:hypothetical protein AGR6A_pb0095 [Agrobacterium sp. NCPPB 925]|nr:hypothetical protein AGR6A_pb0095 [Agrobacterium sp. NCPPB 925]
MWALFACSPALHFEGRLELEEISIALIGAAFRLLNSTRPIHGRVERRASAMRGAPFGPSPQTPLPPQDRRPASGALIEAILHFRPEMS